MVSAANLQDRIYEYGARAAIPRELLSLPTVPVGDGSPHIEILGEEYYFVISERGYEFTRKNSRNLGDILFWFFEGVCSNVAFRYELQNRVPGRDPRRIAFAKKQELLHAIDENWERREAVEVARILAGHPFVDAY